MGGVRILLAVLLLAGCAPAVTAPQPVTLDVQTTARGIAWASLGTGEPLLLLNGTGSPMSEWDPGFLQAMSADRRVIVFDYPGLGQSTARSLRSFPEMADSIWQLLQDLGVERPDILGWSMGGFVAQELLRRHPDGVDRTVLVGTNPGGRGARLGPKWVQKADSDSDGSDRTYLRTNYPATQCAQARGRQFLSRLEQAVVAGRYPMPHTPGATYRRMVRAEDPWLRSQRNAKALPGLRSPVLVMVGDRDVITPPGNSRAIAALIPGATLVTVPAAGHSVLFQDPEQTASVIGAFLDGRALPRPAWPCAR